MLNSFIGKVSNYAPLDLCYIPKLNVINKNLNTKPYNYKLVYTE